MTLKKLSQLVTVPTLVLLLVILNSIPLVPGSVRVTDTIKIYRHGQGIYWWCGAGTTNMTRCFSVTLQLPLPAQPIVATYDLDFQANSDLIPEVDDLYQPVSPNRSWVTQQLMLRHGDFHECLKARRESDGRILNQLYVQRNSPVPFPYTAPRVMEWPQIR